MPASRPSRWPLSIAALSLLAVAARPAAGQQVSAWPLRIDTTAGQLSVYQPQPESFEGDQLSARAAVSLTPPGATEPEFGATWFKARVFTDRDARTVTMQDVDVRQVKLPNATPEQEAQFAALLKQQLPQMNVTFSLDQLEASLGNVQKARVESQQLDNAPPRIVFAQTPTTLVVLDGEPKLQPVADVPGVLRVVNTPFILLLDGGSKQYFLKAGQSWLAAPAVTGPWQAVGTIPGGVAQEGDRLSVQNQASPDQPAASAAPATVGPTQVLVAEEPTELVCSDGPPQYTPLPGNDLLYMANTGSDVFLEVQTQRTFVLLSGRWYTAPSLNGPWQFVASDHLPATFAQIPADSPKANVLASVAGTPQAGDARMDAYVPQTTAIHRDAGAALTVSYDGDPQFVPVAQGSPVTYASNCADPVLYVGNGYYCCHQAVWYQAAGPAGPWGVCTAVPGEIYTIPPSCPVYNCRYVYVYDATPDVVYCGYLPGYTGCYVYGPTVVYGTGYAYPYWYHSEFIPRPVTWGFAPRYDYYSGSWGLGASARYGPAWFAAGPADVRHDWWGPSGYVDYHAIRDSHNTTVVNNYYGGGGNRPDDRRGPAVVNNVRNVTVNRINIYNRQENVTRNVNVNRTVNNRTTNINDVRNTDVRTNVRTDNRNDNRNDNRTNDRGGAATDRAANDVYAGRDGQVYRRTDQGWQQRNTKGWAPVNGEPDARGGGQPRTNARDDTRGGGEPARTPPRTDAPAEQHGPPAEQRGQPAEQRGQPAEQRGEPAGGGNARDRTQTRDRPAETPARAETPSGGSGLEADHVARERGSSRRTGGESDGGGQGRPSADTAPRGGNGGGNAKADNSGGNARGGGGGNGGGGDKNRGH